MRVGVIGAGGHSRGSHLPALVELQDEFDLDLIGVADTSRKDALDAAAAFGFRYGFDLAGELLDENLDACVIVTPPRTIPDLVLRALDLGIPCLVEKPFAHDLAAARRLADEVEDRNGLVMVSANRRFDPALTAAREWLGCLPALVQARMTRHARTEADFVFLTGVHLIDTARFVSSDPSLRIVFADRSTRPGGVAHLRGSGDAIVTLQVAPTTGRDSETIAMDSDDRSVLVRFGSVAGSGWTGWHGGRRVAGDETGALHEWRRNGTLSETRAFLQAVMTGGESPVPLRDYLVSMRIAARLNDTFAGAGS